MDSKEVDTNNHQKAKAKRVAMKKKKKINKTKKMLSVVHMYISPDILLSYLDIAAKLSGSLRTNPLCLFLSQFVNVAQGHSLANHIIIMLSPGMPIVHISSSVDVVDAAHGYPLSP